MFQLTPLGILVGVFVLAAIAALITASIIGFRRPMSWPTVDIETQPAARDDTYAAFVDRTMDAICEKLGLDPTAVREEGPDVGAFSRNVFRTRPPFNGGIVTHRATRYDPILPAPYGMTRHGPEVFRLPEHPDGGTISITVEADPYSEMADAVFRTPVIPATKFQFEPMPTVVEMTEAEAIAIRDKFRAAHPELQKTYSQTRQFPTDPARSDVPGGVYWSIDAQNFYDAAGRAMDQHFTEAWWPRMHEFPQR